VLPFTAVINVGSILLLEEDLCVERFPRARSKYSNQTLLREQSIYEVHLMSLESDAWQCLFGC
jgi:hypothetical protein